MADGPARIEVHRRVATLFALGAVGDLSDGQLVARYLGGRDEAARAAFAALVDRHGTMVLRVCRQAVRGHAHDAQDAFQATFLILARKAGSVRHRESVASWLHGVALRVGRRARADADRRRHRERLAAVRSGPSASPPESWPELHEELDRLPARLREPIVLCYLEGLSTEAAALRLGCPRGTVLSRLSRGRDRLRQRLARRGLDPSVVAVAASRASDPPLAAGIIDATARLAIGFARGRALDLALVSGSSLTLARGTLFAMNLTKCSAIAAATLAGAVGLQAARSYAVQEANQEPEASRSTTPEPGAGKPSDQVPAAADPTKFDVRFVPDADDRSVIEKLKADLAESKQNQAEIREELRSLRQQVKLLLETGGRRTGPHPGTTPPAAIGAERIAFGKGMGPGRLTGDAAAPSYFPIGNVARMIVTSGQGKAILYNPATKERYAFEAADPKDGPVGQIVPVIGPNVVALQVGGPKVLRIAAALPDSGGWYVQDLREPLNGTAVPIVGPGGLVAAYSIGSRVYVFSVRAKRWDMVELPEGSTAIPIVQTDSVTIKQPGHVWTFNGIAGKWSHLDLDAILNEPGPDRP